MAEYAGPNIFVSMNGTEMPQVRRVAINVEGAGVELEDVTHAADTSRQHLDKVPNGGREVAAISALWEAGTASAWQTTWGGVITSGTLLVYPQGTATGNPKLTATGRLMPPSFDHGYDTVHTAEASFYTDQTASYAFTRGSA